MRLEKRNRLEKAIYTEERLLEHTGPYKQYPFDIVDEDEFKTAPRILHPQFHDVFVLICFSDPNAAQNYTIYLHPIAVLDYLTYTQRIAIISYLCFKCKQKDITIHLPDKYKRYNVLTGADEDQIVAAAQDPELRKTENFLNQWLYSKQYRKMEYKPEVLGTAVWFYESSKLFGNDCLVHAVNYALRHPFFVHQEQVVRLMQKKLKHTLKENQEKKVMGGVAASAF